MKINEIMPKVFLISFFCLLFFSCHNSKKNKLIERGFYFWKSGYLSQDNLSQLKQLNVNKLYVKLFEVDFSETKGNFPFAKNDRVLYNLGGLNQTEIVPTIFIKNGIFKSNNTQSLDKLADNIVFLINKYCNAAASDFYENKGINCNEIQIDCDWTKSTKDKYFYLLRKIKEYSNKKISCTLRLYPYKYSNEMGIPPVDKATLMCYNLIGPLSKQNKNSILDIVELKKYLNERREYPIHLDIALPTFYWTQLYRYNRFVKLLDLSPKQVASFTKNIKPFWYQVQRDTAIHYNEYLKEGDFLKCEEVNAKTNFEAIQIRKEMVSFDDQTTVNLFDLDKNTFNHYSYEEINSFYSRFSE